MGIAEAIIPPFAFVALLAIFPVASGLPWLAMLSSSALALVFILIRIVRREAPAQAIAGLVAVVASVLLAAFTNRAENNFLPGIYTNIAYGIAFVISLVVRWPLVGVAVGLITKRGHGWRSDKKRFRILFWLTVLWVGMFAIRVAVELPLYFSSNVSGLGVAKLVLGLPLYAPVLVLTWVFVRGMFAEDIHRGEENKVS